MAIAYLDVDISDLQMKIAKLRAVHTKEEFERLMYRAFRRTGGHVRTIMKKDIPAQYTAKPTWIGSNVGSPRTQMGGTGGTGVSCTIPIYGARGILGANFKASGPRGRRSKSAKAYKITAKIVKQSSSTLPDKMPGIYGGNPPFLTRAGKIKGGLVLTRKTAARLPIIRVVGIGVPQMPMNRSEDAVQNDIMETLKKRMDHEHAYLIGRCR